jgi:hypothetical protein
MQFPQKIQVGLAEHEHDMWQLKVEESTALAYKNEEECQ